MSGTPQDICRGPPAPGEVFDIVTRFAIRPDGSLEARPHYFEHVAFHHRAAGTIEEEVACVRCGHTEFRLRKE